MQSYVCIECGKDSCSLYKEFRGGIIKISHCEYCGGVVDKYIEYDTVIMSLDVALHKKQAYRHILYNSRIQSHWRFAILFLFCDTYTKWINWPGSHLQYKSESDFIFYAALEWSFYLMFLVSALEFIAFYVVLNAILRLSLKDWSKEKLKNVIKGVLLSNMGKLLVVPAIIWGQSNSMIYLTLTHIFIFVSNMQTLRVMCSFSMMRAATMVAVLHSMEHLTVQLSQSYLVPFLDNTPG